MSWAVNINKDDIRDAQVVDETPQAGDGEVLVRIDEYAMTANNITYAAFGKPMGLFGNDQGYWDFFSPGERPGRLPVWGFATVESSSVDGVAEGDRFYGYYPMASHAVLRPGKAGASGFADITPHRTSLPPIYNNYQKLDALPDYRAEHHDYWPIFRPLFLTGWLIADQYEDESDYGVAQAIIASASSKTAIGLGYSLAQRSGSRPRSIGLTSAANVADLAATGVYDEVVSYDDIGSLDASKPSGYVDMAGNDEVTRAVHAHFTDNLKHSMIVGKSHWDAAASGGDLPGPEREGFFAPGRSQKRIADWGAPEFGKRIAESWLSFMTVAPDFATIDARTGSDAALEAYREVLDGKADPKTGIIVRP